VVYRILEDRSWVDSFYICTVAVTTVGSGDLTPSTDASKLFTVFYIFSGLTIISVWLNARFKHHAAKAVVTRTGPATDASDSPDSGS
jgi:voltage-gated potassium channel Kch